jgi:hypothetical protein
MKNLEINNEEVLICINKYVLNDNISLPGAFVQLKMNHVKQFWILDFRF